MNWVITEKETQFKKFLQNMPSITKGQQWELQLV